MGNYYCLMAGVPDIALEDARGAQPVLAFKEELAEQLTEADKKLMYYLYLRYDCLNLVKLLKNPNAEINPVGNYTREQYEDLINSAREMNFNVHRFPQFLSIFAREYQYNKDKVGYFPEDVIEGYNIGLLGYSLDFMTTTTEEVFDFKGEKYQQNENKIDIFSQTGEKIVSIECNPFVPQIRYVNPEENTVGYFITVRLRYVNRAQRKTVEYECED